MCNYVRNCDYTCRWVCERIHNSNVMIIAFVANCTCDRVIQNSICSVLLNLVSSAFLKWKAPVWGTGKCFNSKL